MELNLDKKSLISWKIKNKEFETLSISAVEQNKELIEVLFSQTNLKMNFNQFSQYYNYLTQVKNAIEFKYISKSKIFTKKSVEEKIAKLSLEGSLKIPEVYFITNNGLCLFHFLAYHGKVASSPINQNLVSGLLSAINSFAENIGWLSGVKLIKSGETEVRFSKKGHIFVAMMTNVNIKLSHLVEPVLFDFANDLGETFEKKYAEQIDKCYEKGLVDSDDFSDFQEIINDFFVIYRKQTFDLYQKLIITEALYLGVNHDICTELIHNISEGKSVINQITDLMNAYPVITKAIQKVNFDQKPFWEIFGVPIFEL